MDVGRKVNRRLPPGQGSGGHSVDSMRAYVVFTRIRTRDPAELAQYTAQAPAFVAGHTVERLANFGACAVLEGLGGQTSPLPTAGQRFPPIASPPQRDSGFRDVANLHHRALIQLALEANG